MSACWSLRRRDDANRLVFRDANRLVFRVLGLFLGRALPVLLLRLRARCKAFHQGLMSGSRTSWSRRRAGDKAAQGTGTRGKGQQACAACFSVIQCDSV